MKSIEERAQEYNKKYFSTATDLVQEAIKIAYIVGAKEQRKIDIMQTRQFLEREAAYNGSMSCVDDLLIEELCKAIGEQI